MTTIMTVWGIITIGGLLYGMCLPYINRKEDQKLFRKYK